MMADTRYPRFVLDGQRVAKIGETGQGDAIVVSESVLLENKVRWSDVGRVVAIDRLEPAD